MDHEKKNYRRDERGIVRYEADGKGAVANLQQRTAVGRHKDGSVYLRATDSEDVGKVKDIADVLGIGYRQRRGGASHFGRLGSYEHLHFDTPADVASVHAALGYHLEENGKVADHDAHLKKLSGGLKNHVQGKDARVDACMVNTRHAHEMSLEAGRTDTPEAHRSASQFHRLSAEAHRAQAARPWTKGEGAHHAGLAILHDQLASQHEKKAWAAHKRIQAELKRKAEMKARMEAMEEGRETKKALVHQHTREVNGKLVVVHEHQDSRPDAKEKTADPTDGKIDRNEAPTYKKAVAENLKHMGTHSSEWEACPITMVETPEGKMAPDIEWPKDYKSAPTLYPSNDQSVCCELCGTGIKNVFGLQNHKREWLLRVGSECVTHFAQGKSGEKLSKEAKHAANVALYQEALDVRKQIEQEFTEPFYKTRVNKGIGMPKPYFNEWNHPKAWQAWQKLFVCTTTGGKDYNTNSASSMSTWVANNKDKAAEAIKKAEELLGRSFKKAHAEGDKWVMGLDEAIAEHKELVHTLETPGKDDDQEEAAEQDDELKNMEAAKGREIQKDLGTAGAGTDLSTLEGGGALRAEGHDDELADATMGREVQKAEEMAYCDACDEAYPKGTKHECPGGRPVQKAEPSEAQIKAGNYAMEHHKVHGLDISIENPIGSIRRGVAKDGKPWETKMSHHYGYIKRTEGADGDHVDCFLGPNPESPYVHIVNQIEPTTGKFDEHKVMVGFASREAAIEGYHDNYQAGWKGCDEVKTMHVDDFKDWLKHGNTRTRLVYKAAQTRLHTVSRIQMQVLRTHPGMRMSPGFTDAVHSARTAGLTDAEILRTIKNATGAFTPLVKHLEDCR